MPKVPTLPKLIGVLAIFGTFGFLGTFGNLLAASDPGHPLRHGTRTARCSTSTRPPGRRTMPVGFGIHGGGWQTGDKGMVALKPKAFMDAASSSCLSITAAAHC